MSYLLTLFKHHVRFLILCNLIIATNGEAAALLKKPVTAYQNSKYKPMFAFLLRQESGMADTIDK